MPPYQNQHNFNHEMCIIEWLFKRVRCMISFNVYIYITYHSINKEHLKIYYKQLSPSYVNFSFKILPNKELITYNSSKVSLYNYQINRLTMKNYFSGHKEIFEQVSADKRNAYLTQLLETPHQIGTPYDFSQSYPQVDEFTFQDYQIHYYHTNQHASPKALVFYLHGLYSTGGVYAYFGNKVAQAVDGVNVYAIDFLNFGKSVGDYRGYIESFQFILAQAEAFVNHITAKFQGRTITPKLFLVGHSFGGTIAFKMTLRNPSKYSGVIFFVPALRQIKISQYIMKKIGKFIGYLFPKLKLTSQKYDDFRYASQPSHKNNHLVYNGRNIPGSIRVVLNAIEQIQNEYDQFEAPYIVFQGGVDKLVDIFAPLDLEESCKSKDKTTVYIKDMWHNIYYEKEIEQVVQMCGAWLKARV